MKSEEILQRLFMSSAEEAEELSQKKQPDYVIDVRAEAAFPLQDTASRQGTKSFSLINGGPTDPEELKCAIQFAASVLQNDGSVLIH